jgi:mannose-6-phosphate isomerase-like protein (cupin superfamily)
VWYVLSGRVRFRTTDEKILAELGPNETILIPRTFPYSFECAGSEELVLLQVEAFSGAGEPVQATALSDKPVDDVTVEWAEETGQ